MLKPLLRVSIGLTALLSLATCTDDVDGPSGQQELTCDAQTYAEAVREAVEPSMDDVHADLVPITPSNPQLIWNTDRTAVRMVVWTTYAGYVMGENALSREVWVTSAPQVQELCKTLAAEQLVPRINQFLGLPPATEQDDARYFVEMWVKPGDMFRPCPDAEIDDSSCSLTFPALATAEHKAWMNSNYAYSYGFWQATQYPWTGLGYTYDWCNEETQVGASEFVIRAGSTVTVTGKFERTVYCAG